MKKTLLAVLLFAFVFVGIWGQAVEEEILVEGTDQLLKYSLSNNLEEIEKAITSRTGENLDLSETGWRLNPSLSKSVKDLMNRHNVNYSMTTYLSPVSTLSVRVIIINRLIGDKWFIMSWTIMPY